MCVFASGRVCLRVRLRVKIASLYGPTHVVFQSFKTLKFRKSKVMVRPGHFSVHTLSVLLSVKHSVLKFRAPKDLRLIF